MKFLVLVVIAISFTANLDAQNVGIGSPSPNARLQINSRATIENPTLKLYDSSTSSVGGPVMQFTSNGINQFSIRGSLANSGTPSSSYLDYIYNDRLLSSLSGDGRMTIAAEVAEGRLQINHRSSVTDPTIVIFDSATQSAGRIRFKNASGARFWQVSSEVNNSSRTGHYMDFMTDSSTIMTLRGNGRVGINNVSPNYLLDVNGDANFTGAIRVNSNPGTAGQVLTSNGNGDATWGRTALSNTTRFAFTGSDGAAITSFLTNFSTTYNTNTTDVTIGINTVTFNKTGLYHLEGSVNGRVDYSATPANPPVLTLSFVLDGNKPVAKTIFDQRISSSTLSYTGVGFYSYDSYFTAGQVLQLAPAYGGGGGGAAITLYDTATFLRGYLISE